MHCYNTDTQGIKAHTHLQTLKFQCFTPPHFAGLPAAHTPTHWNTGAHWCCPLYSPCLICQDKNSPSLKNLSQMPPVSRLSSHNSALPAHMLLSITQICHTAGVTRPIHHFHVIAVYPLHIHREEDIFDLQGYSEKKAPLWQKLQPLEISCQLTDWVCVMVMDADSGAGNCLEGCCGQGEEEASQLFTTLRLIGSSSETVTCF